jgi:hypothetical protein
MKKTHLLIAAAIVSIGFTACKSSSDEAKKDAEVLTMYVDSVENLAPVYTFENWTVIDNGYNERALNAEKTNAALKEEDRDKTEASKAKYATLKAKYEFNIKENEANAKLNGGAANFRKVLRDRLFGEGKIGDDMKFEFVTAANIHGVYKNFVDRVDENRKNYTREDWDEINVLYEALDTRKNTVEKEGLTSGDNNKIALLKVKYAAINATHRGGTKLAENKEAKQ